MGKGDKKSTKGKRIAGSYGNTRPRNKKTVVPQAVVEKVAEPKEEKPKAVKKKKTEE